MDLALNNLQRLICHKTQQTNQSDTIMSPAGGVIDLLGSWSLTSWISQIQMFFSYQKDHCEASELMYLCN